MMKLHNFLWMLVIPLAGCMQSEEEKVKQELTQIGQCYYAGEMAHAAPALRERIDEQLMFKASSAKMAELRKAKPNVNLNFSMEVATNIAGREIEDERLPANKVKKLLKWYESDYCQSIASAYEDKLYGPADEQYEKSKKSVPDPLNYRTALYLSRDRSDALGKDVACKDYQETYAGLVSNSALKAHRDLLAKSLTQMLLQSILEMDGYRRDVVQSMVQEDIAPERLAFGRGIYGDINLRCRSTVRETVGDIGYIKNAMSPRTKGLMEMEDSLKRESQDCGEFSQRYCRGKLKLEAIRYAADLSAACDRNASVKDCAATDYSEVYEQRMAELELDRLQKFIGYLSAYIADPAKYKSNIEGNTQDQMEACKKEALQLKYNDTDYRDSVNLYCKPKAYWSFTKPQLDELDAMVRRVRQLKKEEPSLKMLYGMSLDLAQLAPTSFMWACTEQEAANIEKATSTRIQAYRQVQSICQRQVESLKSSG